MKKFFLYLNIVRWKNLLLLVFCQLFFKYKVFVYFKAPSYLTGFEFFLLLISIVCIAAGGYVINDVFDVSCDQINKPQKSYIPNQISIKNANALYYALTVLGVVSGSYLCISIEKPFFAFLSFVIAGLLYLYSYKLKSIALLGNIIISLLISFNLILLVLLDSNIYEINRAITIAIQFSFFSFFINLFRELIKDIEDINGDYNSGMKTLPILIGTSRTIKLILLLSSFFLYFLINFGIQDLQDNIWAQAYFALFIVLPYLVFLIKTYNAKSKQHFHKMSSLLKLILAFGLLLLIIITI